MKQIAKMLAGFMLLMLAQPPASLGQPGWLKEVVKEGWSISSHKDAAAITLHSSTAVKIFDDGRAGMQVRQAYKILKPSGEEFGVLAEAISPFRKVKDLKGWAYFREGNTRTLTKENVVQISMPGTETFYDDSQLLVARLPDIKPETILAFEYNIENVDLTGAFQRFVFQKQQPVKFAQFAVSLPEGWQMHQTTWHSDRLAYAQNGNSHSWTASELPYLLEEPLMPSWHALSPRVAVTCYNSGEAKTIQFPDWAAVARWCAEMHREAALPEEAVRQQALQLTQGLATTEEKLRAIADFVRDEVRYVAVEIGEGRWRPRPSATTLRNRFGDCKDKTALMRAMLQAIGIASVSVIANTNYAVKSELPTPFQFNHCIVGIPLTGQKNKISLQHSGLKNWLFFDPTDRATRLGDLPPALQGDLVLLATAADTVLQHLPYGAPQDNRRRYFADVQLSADGGIAAQIRITDFGNWAAFSRHDRRTTPKEKLIEAWQSRLAQTVTTAALTDFQSGDQGDSAWVAFTIKGNQYARLMGALMILKADFFHVNAPPELTAERRQHPIWFGPAQQIETDIVWHLPAGLKLEEEMPEVEDSCGAARLSYKISSAGNVLRFSSVVQQSGYLLSASDYPAARKFSQNLSKAKSMALVLKKS